MKKPDFNASLETQTLTKKLGALAPGEFISYADLSKAIKGDAQGKHRSALNSAQRILLNDSGAVFGTVRNEGVRRLLPEEVSQKTPSLVAKVRRAARKHGRELASVNTTGFNQEQSKAHADSMLQTALIGASVSKATQKRLHDVSNPANPGLDKDSILAIYGNGGVQA